MKRLSFILVIMLGMFLLYLSTYSAEDKPKATVHKITKDEIDKEFTCIMCNMKMKVAKNTPALDYKGATYYFCSAGEKKLFFKNPEMYLPKEKVESNKMDYIEHKIIDEELGKKVTCPVTKETFTITKNTPAIDFNGETYYFCCPGCIGKFFDTQTKTDSLKVEPDTLHNMNMKGKEHSRKGCC